MRKHSPVHARLAAAPGCARAARMRCGASNLPVGRRADKGTGKKQDIKITGASTLASDEVDRMVKDAEKFADEVRRVQQHTV